MLALLELRNNIVLFYSILGLLELCAKVNGMAILQELTHQLGLLLRAKHLEEFELTLSK